MKKNIFLTGPSSSGKTTIIKKVIKKPGLPANGFYTEEEKASGKRLGFLMKTPDGRTGYLAHQDIISDFHIRRYGVSIENNVIILDEIGIMECFSEVFKQAATNVLDSPNIVVGTITLGGDDFIQEIKNRGDIEINEVTMDNRDSLPNLILRKISNLLKTKDR
ncbi:MAG: nucleoside-triphosphatase [Thermodesulfobacteriota bacterium]|nr:nucleoside-triphosphatase [Thermodesulfobacteriota bacterium]